MNLHFLRRHARFALTAALLALAFAAASPTLNALRAQLMPQAQPTLFAALCTSMGFIRVAVDSNNAANDPAAPSPHSIECAWCVQPGHWLVLGHADALHLPVVVGRNTAPLLAFAPSPLAIIHTVAHSRGPPFIS